MARFKKGQSGNPKGRPKALDIKEFRELARAEAPKALEKLIALSEFAQREGDQIKAIELLLAYGFGKPSQSHEISGPNGSALPLQMVDMPPVMNREEWLKHYNKNHAHKK